MDEKTRRRGASSFLVLQEGLNDRDSRIGHGEWDMAVRGNIDGENFQGNVSVFACLGVWSSCVRTKGG